MNKFTSVLMAVILSASMLFQTGCYGSFSLTRKVYEFNGDIGDKFINTIVFWVFVIIPVYGVTLILDGILFNLIEFWTGSNPVAMNEGDMEQQLITKGNREYMLTATKNKFHIEQVAGPEQGEWLEILFEPETSSCYLNYQGKVTRILEYDPDDLSNLRVYLPNGRTVAVDGSLRDRNLIRNMLEDETLLVTAD